MPNTNDYTVIDRKIASVKKDLANTEKMPEGEFRDSMMAELYDELARLTALKKEFKSSEYTREPDGDDARNAYTQNAETQATMGWDGTDDFIGADHGRNWRNVVLPAALSNRFTKYLLSAVIVLILTVVLLVMYRTPQCCIGFILCAFLVYMGFELRFDYADGKIKEIAVTCASVSQNTVRKSVRVVFRTDDDPPTYYDFTLSGNLKQHSDLQANYVYVIYFKEDDPRNLLAYIQL